jgi:hypothetical protein
MIWACAGAARLHRSETPGPGWNGWISLGFGAAAGAEVQARPGRFGGSLGQHAGKMESNRRRRRGGGRESAGVLGIGQFGGIGQLRGWGQLEEADAEHAQERVQQAARLVRVGGDQLLRLGLGEQMQQLAAILTGDRRELEQPAEAAGQRRTRRDQRGPRRGRWRWAFRTGRGGGVAGPARAPGGAHRQGAGADLGGELGQSAEKRCSLLQTLPVSGPAMRPPRAGSTTALHSARM